MDEITLDNNDFEEISKAFFDYIDYNDKKQRLWDLCEDFINEQEISAPETIYQSDRVIQNAYDLIEKICDIVGYQDLT